MKVYCSIPKAHVEKILSKGLKIEDYSESRPMGDGQSMDCIVTYLVPGDVIYDETLQAVLAVEVDPKETFVTEGAYRGDVKGSFYWDSAILLKDYCIGAYANPECPITVSVTPENLEPLASHMGFPVLYDDSENLYAERTFDLFCDKYGNMKLYSVRCCCEALCNAGKMSKVRIGDSLVFTDKRTGEKIVIPGR